MITKVIMPQMSLTMQTGLVSKWLKSQGEMVSAGEQICTIEGDKAALDIEAPASGILLRIVAQEGQEFPVKQIMAYIGDREDVIEEESAAVASTPQTTTPQTDQKVSTAQSESSDDRIKASPVAKRLANEKGIDLSKIKGTGPDGLIGKEDILSFIEGKTLSSEMDSFKEFNSIEKIIAEKMTESNRDIPHFHLSSTCKLGQANILRKEINNVESTKTHITLTDLIIWSVSRSLKKYPDLNSSYEPNKIIFQKSINVGLAVNTPDGLLVVVIKKADEKSVFDIASVREELTHRAALGKQTPDDLSDCTFTISNLGMYGIESFDPIITPGQVGILGVGALVNSLEFDEKGSVVSVEKLTLTLGCDHRAIDGVAGAEFLSDIRNRLENPSDIFKA